MVDIKQERKFSTGYNLDEPPHSRLFIVSSKSLNENDFREAFEKFGNIEEIWTVKDRQSGENKGITYVKFSKTSEAAKALEAMNGKCIGDVNRHIRVMIAASRDQGCRKDVNEEEKTQRLFVVVPKTMADAELYDYFKVYGDIDYATIIRDRETQESKGFAYIKYFKFSHAATAYEECDRKYKAVFAEPRKTPHTRNEEKHSNSWDSLNKINTFNLPSLVVNAKNSYTKLIAVVSPQVNQDQLWKLFDIIPGLDYCHLKLEGRPRPNKGIATIVYNSSYWAAYAREKIHGFEYPPGSRIIVKPDPDSLRNSDGTKGANFENCKGANILQIAETIAQASSLVEASGLSSGILQLKRNLTAESKDTELTCSVQLPDPQSLASQEAKTVSRCFIVCSPNPLPNSILKDVFSRFGHLIDVYMLNNRNCGFAKYANLESAENAIKVLHGAEVCGVKIKVLKAEEKPDCSRKRQRLEEKS